MITTPLTAHFSAFGVIVAVVIAALFLPFGIVAARAQNKAAATRAAAEAAGTPVEQPTMDPGLLARKKLGVWCFGGLAVFCAIFMVGGLIVRIWGEAISFGLFGAFSLWLMLRLRGQIRRA